MSSAKVILKEIDLSIRVPSFPGVYVAMVLDAKRGPVDTPQLITSEAQLLERFTPEGTIKVGYSAAYYSAIAALERTDKLWVQRVVGENITYSGALAQASTGDNATWTNTDVIAIGDAVAATDSYTVTSGKWTDLEAVQVTGTTEELTNLGLTAGNIYYVIYVDATTIKLAASLADASADTAITISSDSTSAVTISSVTPDPTLKDFGASDMFFLHASDPGEWGNTVYAKWHISRNNETLTLGDGGDVADDTEILTVTQDWVTGEAVRVSLSGASSGDALPTGLSANTTYYVINASATTIKLATTEANAVVGTAINITSKGSGSMLIEPVNKVTEPNTFTLEIFVNNTTTPVETYTLNRVEGSKDGYGKGIYLESALEASNYVRAIDNTAITDTTLPKAQPVALQLTTGVEGSSPSSSHWVDAADKYDNASSYPITCLIDSGQSNAADIAYPTKLISIVENRRDCVTFLSTPITEEQKTDYIGALTQYRDQLSSTSYAALYTPHVKITDRFNDRKLYVSPDGYAAASLSFSAYNYELWFPVAGNKRGRILGVEDVTQRFQDGEMDRLYEKGINPIRFKPGEGIVIWGQKTLQTRPSALDRLNVRLLCIVIQPAIKVLLEDFLFDFNTVETRSLAVSAIESYMRRVKARQGVTDFYVVSDDTNNTDNDIDNHIMNVDLFIKPTISAEYINFTTIITRSGVSFEVAQELV